MATHKHKPKYSTIRPFTGPIVGVRENRAAHGGIQVHEVCRCGSERYLNVNGRHVERGPWYPSAIDLDTYIP